MTTDETPPGVALDVALIDQLVHGPLHRFADYATLSGIIPGSGAGVYTIWDEAGDLVPFGRDQPEVARRVAEAGAGVALSAKRLTATTLHDAFSRAVALRPRLDDLADRLAAGGASVRFVRRGRGADRLKRSETTSPEVLRKFHAHVVG